MSRSLIINTLILMTVIAHAKSQYIDLFQSFSAFIQPFSTTRKPDITKRPTSQATTKQRYQDTIFFETDDFIKQKESATLNPFTTTVKPRRKTKATTRKPTTRAWFQDTPNVGSHDRNYNGNTERTTHIYKANNYDVNQIINNSRYNNVYGNYNYEVTDNVAKRTTTQRPVVYNNNFNVAQKPTSRPTYNRDTTINPLLYRPGVRPAVVDDNRPPITNKPVTSRPYYDRPVTAKPVGTEGTEPGIEIGPDEDAMSETEKRRYIEIAEQKCDEYKAMNTKKVVALPLATIHGPQGVEVDVPTCTPINIPLIIGGKVVSIQEFPHMSLVGWKNIQKGGFSWKCGGSLISDQYILTAGHCTYHDKDYNVISGPPAAVQLGSSYIDGGDALVVTISSVVRHPKYKVRRSYYDVALIKLTTTVRFSDKISPACLGTPPPVGDRIITTGWGRTEFGGDSSQELRSVSVPIWDMGECRSVWGTSRKLPEGPSPASQLCAGERSGGKDTCQGDSGGPAQVQDGCTWRVVAVTSVGRSCGAAETPALYAKLPRAFISSQVFSNVKLSNNRHNNSNNGNNNWGTNNNNNNGNNNWSTNNNNNNGNNNWGTNNNNNNGNNNWNYNNQGNQNYGSNRDEVIRPGNHQTVGNNWGVTDSQFGNTQSFGINSGVIRPGNHQSIDNNRAINNNQFVNSHGTDSNRDENVYRPGNHQTVDNNNNRRDVNEGNYFVTSHTSGNNRDAIVSRPGNHQTIESNNRGNDAVSNYFVTSHTSGNNRDTVVSRPGNHQTVDNNNRDNVAVSNYFVTSHTSGSAGTVSRPGNHQTLGNNNNNNRGIINNNSRFADSLNSESNQNTRYQSNDNYNGNNQNNNAQIYNNNNPRNTNTWGTTIARPETNNNNHYNKQQTDYYNEHNSRSTKTYSNFEPQNSDYRTTENVLHNRNNNRYNDNNNGYIVNNNREFTVANRPWWNR